MKGWGEQALPVAGEAECKVVRETEAGTVLGWLKLPKVAVVLSHITGAAGASSSN